MLYFRRRHGSPPQLWARVKGRTENALAQLPVKAVYNFRPDVQHTLSYYKYLGWLPPLLWRFAPKYINSLQQLGNAMINAARFSYGKTVLEVPDIKALAAKA